MGGQFARSFTVVLIASIVGSCGFTSRSDEFKCQTTDECSDGRVCHDNWCVVPDSIGDANVSGPDAAMNVDAPVGSADAMMSIDATPCPAECTSCSGDLCTIDCNADDSCAGGVTCPVGLRCEVICSGDSACAGNVDCEDATECSITCSSNQSCQGRIDCGDGPCTVVCSGTNSCADRVDCNTSCACTTDCGGTNACADGNPNCPGPGGTCRTAGNCVLDPAVDCNTCP